MDVLPQVSAAVVNFSNADDDQPSGQRLANVAHLDSLTRSLWLMAFPINTKSYRVDIGGHETDFSFSLYSDRTLVFISQVGSVASFVSASQDHAGLALSLIHI